MPAIKYLAHLLIAAAALVLAAAATSADAHRQYWVDGVGYADSQIISPDFAASWQRQDQA